MIFGYLDPVTGSALLQVGLGVLAAAGLGWQYVRKFTRTVLARFRGETAAPVDAASDFVDADSNLS